MDLTLKRQEYYEDGIFGDLEETESGDTVAATLEHAYAAGNGDGSYTAKLAPGKYVCRRRLSPHFGYEVFQVMNAPPFQGTAVSFIEIHRGNFNRDSEGCILVGTSYVKTDDGIASIAQSKVAFDKLMALQEGLDTFMLTVLA